MAIDDDEDDEVEEAADEDDDTPVLVVRRLSDLDGWELYRASQSVAWSLATIAILPPAADRRMEYALFRNDAGAASIDAEPLVKGHVDTAPSPSAPRWDDDARREVLRAILEQTEDELGVGPVLVDLQLGDEDDDEEEDLSLDEDEPLG